MIKLWSFWRNSEENIYLTQDLNLHSFHFLKGIWEFRLKESRYSHFSFFIDLHYVQCRRSGFRYVCWSAQSPKSHRWSALGFDIAAVVRGERCTLPKMGALYDLRSGSSSEFDILFCPLNLLRFCFNWRYFPSKRTTQWCSENTQRCLQWGILRDINTWLF